MENSEVKMCPGLEIPIVNISKKESSLDITIERIREYHHTIGEDFLDYENNEVINSVVFGGFLLGKFPDLAGDIIEIFGEGSLDTHSFKDLFEYDVENGIEGIYHPLCEFINLTKVTKKRMNEILISVQKYHIPKDDNDIESLLKNKL